MMDEPIAERVVSVFSSDERGWNKLSFVNTEKPTLTSTSEAGSMFKSSNMVLGMVMEVEASLEAEFEGSAFLIEPSVSKLTSKENPWMLLTSGAMAPIARSLFIDTTVAGFSPSSGRLSAMFCTRSITL